MPTSVSPESGVMLSPNSFGTSEKPTHANYMSADEWDFLNFDGTLSVNCWCEDAIVHVPQELVKRGITLPCMRKMCQEIAREKGQVNVKDDAGLAMSQMWRQVHQPNARNRGHLQPASARKLPQPKDGRG